MSAASDTFKALSINQLARELRASGRSIIPLSVGQPSSGAPPAAIAAAKAVLDSDPMGYWESAALRERLARYYAESYGISIAAERFVLTAGASAALSVALTSLFKPGDRVAFARPGYFAYRAAVAALHLHPVEIACGPETAFQVTAGALRRLDPPPAGLILASPANPTGAIIPAREMSEMIEVCRDRGIRIVSDEIYHGLHYAAPARSVLEFEPNATVISSFSKYFSMVGWRIGWLVAPEGELAGFRRSASALFLTTASLSQHAALAALDSLDVLNGHLEMYRQNRALMLKALPAMGIKAITPPDGAFYVYADVSHLTEDSAGLCHEWLTEAGVAVAPGADFDAVDGHRFIRFSFAASTEEVGEALDRLERWFARRAEAPHI